MVAMKPMETVLLSVIVAAPLPSCASESGHRAVTVEKLAGDMGFTEGPVWLPAAGKLVFSDIPNSLLMEWSEEAGLAVFRESANPNGNRLDLEGRLLTCQHGARNIVRTETDGALTVLADRVDGKRFNSPNDVAVKSDGTLWFTDPPWGLKNRREGKELDGHYVYRLDPDGAVTTLIRDLAMPNGIAFSPDEQRLYVADTGDFLLDLEPGSTARPPTLTAYDVGSDNSLSVEPAWRVEALCDGMCVDEEGTIYATGHDGMTLWTADGAPAGTILVPEQPANACFGGDDRKTLFITARTSLYAVRMDVAGAAPPRSN